MEKPPCSIDCPFRSPTCHSTCVDYAAYSQRKEQIRNARFQFYCEDQDLRAERKVALNRHYRHRR